MLNFDKHINQAVKNFTGRHWVFEIIDNWIARFEAKRFLVLTGEPGSGKTALAARLTEYSKGNISPEKALAHFNKSFLKAIHFCSAKDLNYINPKTFTDSLAAQLAQNVPGFLEALIKRSSDRQINLNVDVSVGTGSATGVVIGKLNLVAETPEDAFMRFIREPLEEVIKNGFTEKIIILVDGLDEALQYTGEIKISDLLTETEYLPSNVQFIITTRSSPEVIRSLRFSGMELTSLTSESGLIYSLDDIKEFVKRRVNENAQLKSLLGDGFSADSFATIIKEKSAGNFLYVTLLLQALETEREVITVKSLENFPSGLDDFYLKYLIRLKKKPETLDILLPVLGILAVSREPISEEQISIICQIHHSKIRKAFGSIAQFLDIDEKSTSQNSTYTLFHRSFSDFLLQEKQSQEFWCEEKEQHKKYVTTYLLSYEPLRLNYIEDSYLWKHLIFHLVGAGLVEKAHNLLLNYDWLDSKLKATKVDSLLSDFEVLQQEETLRILHSAIRLSSHALREDKNHLRGQLIGRLLNIKDLAIVKLLNKASNYKGKIWLRPLTLCLVKPVGFLQQTVKLNTNPEGIALPSNKNWCIIASDNGSLFCWQIAPVKHLYSLIENNRGFSFNAIQISEEGRIAATAGTISRESDNQTNTVSLIKDPTYKQDFFSTKYVRIFDLETGHERLRILCDVGNKSSSIALAGNKILAIVSVTELRCWDLDSGLPYDVPKIDAKWYEMAARGNSVVCRVHLIKRKKITRRELVSDRDSFLYFDPIIYSQLTSENLDDEIEVEDFWGGEAAYIIWNITDSKKFKILPGDPCDDLDITPDGNKIITNWAGKINFIDVTSDTIITQLNENPNKSQKDYHYISFLENGSKAVSLDGDFLSNDPPVLTVWDLVKGEEVLKNYGHTSIVISLNTDFSGTHIVTGTSDGTIRFWNSQFISTTSKSLQHTRRINSVCVSNNNQLACSASDDAKIIVWDLKELKEVALLIGHKDRINSIAFTLDSSKIISASSDGTIRIWSTKTFMEENVFLGHKRGVNGITIHPDGKRFLSTSTDVSIRCWDIESGASTILFPEGNRAHVPTSIAFDGTGKRFALGQGEGRDVMLLTADVSYTSMVVWDFDENDFIAEGEAQHDVEAVLMSNDGKYVYYTTSERICKKQVEDGKEIFSVLHEGDTTGIALLPDELYALSVSRGGDILLWDTNNGNTIAHFKLDSPLEACAVTRNGKTIIVGDNEGQVNFFRIEGLSD